MFSIKQLISIEALGDPHANGRRVLKIGVLTSTDEQKFFIYKPRNITPEIAYSTICSWFSTGLGVTLKSQKTIDCQEYGYCEFIDYSPCKTVEEVKNYYYRLGVLLNISYLIGLNDLHFENIIPNGEHPVIVDNECMMNPYINKRKGLRMEVDVLWTVLDSSLLPGKYYFTTKTDMSGLCPCLEIELPFDEKILVNNQTDQLKISYSKRIKKQYASKPTLNKKQINLSDYKNDFKEGFSAAYHLTLACRDGILNNHYSAFALLAVCKTRLLLRHTRSYRKLQQESYHPALLHSHQQFANHFEKLNDLYAYFPHSPDLAASEKSELLEGDIPIFYTFTNKTTVYNAQGNGVYFNKGVSGYEVYRYKLNYVYSEEDLVKQSQIIENSFIVHDLTLKKPISYSKSHPYRKDDQDAVIHKIMNKLDSLSLENEGRIAWPTIEPLTADKWSSKLTDIDLYAGTAGIGLLYLNYYKLFANERHRKIAKKCLLDNLNDRLILVNDSFIHDSVLGNTGFYTGISGVIYGLYCLYCVEQQQNIIAKIIELVEMLDCIINITVEVDLLSGLMGALLVLLLVKKVIPQKTYLLISNKILKQFFKIYPKPELPPNSKSKSINQQPLLGFSHGTSGILWVLHFFYQDNQTLTPLTQVKAWIDAALIYERKHYAKKHHNWPRFDKPKRDDYQYSTSWCHGAPGIGFSRVSLMGYDNLIERELSDCVQTTYDYLICSKENACCLCHGDYGNLDFLLTVRSHFPHVLDEPSYLSVAKKIIAKTSFVGLERAIVANGNTMGLMTGIAGVAYQLLRLKNFPTVPSVLFPTREDG